MAATAERPAMLRCRVLQGETSVLTTEKGREPSTVHHAWRNSRGRFAYITIADGNKRAQKYTQHLWRRIYQWSRQNGTLRQNGPAPCFRGEGLFFISCSKLSSGFRLGWFFFPNSFGLSRLYLTRRLAMPGLRQDSLFSASSFLFDFVHYIFTFNFLHILFADLS